MNLLDEGHVARLLTHCRTEGITMVVLDTWTALAHGGDPDSAKDQALLAGRMVMLAAGIDGLVVVIDHARKNPPSNTPTMSDIYGPNQKMQKAEHAIVLRRLEDSETRVEVLIDSKDTDGVVRFYLDRSPVGDRTTEKFTYAGSVEEARASGATTQRERGHDNRERVYEALPRPPGWHRVEEIIATLAVQHLQLGPSAVRSHLGVLLRDGRIDKQGEGRSRRYQRRVLTGPGVSAETSASPGLGVSVDSG